MNVRPLLLLFTLLAPTKVQAQFYYESHIGASIPVDQFREPTDVAVDGAGNIYIVDTSSNLIKKFNSNGEPLSQWGGGGRDPGQLRNPMAIAVDGNGYLYVADLYASEVEIFNSSGGKESRFGSYGTSNGQINGSRGVAIHPTNGNIYVVDIYNNRIQVFKSDHSYLTQWGSSGTGDKQFNSPTCIAIDANGNVYVGDSGNHRIQKFNSSGGFDSKWGSYGSGDYQFNSPSGIAVDASGNVYVSDTGNNRVQKFNILRQLTSSIGTYGSGDVQFSSPMGLEVDANGKIYVSDYANKRIQILSSTGLLISKIGNVPSDGVLNNPHGVAVDASKNIYVADLQNHRIQKFNSSGNFVTKWGSLGVGSTQFNSPFGVAVDAAGFVYVTDQNNNRVKKFDASGNAQGDWGGAGTGNGQFNTPKGLAVAANGDIYVVDAGNNRVQIFTSSGVYKDQWGSVGIGQDNFNDPRGIAIDAADDIYVADAGNNRIQKFNNSGDPKTRWKIDLPGVFNYPVSIAISPTQHVYVVTQTNFIQKFTSTGDLEGTWGTYGWENGTLLAPKGIVADALGNVYITDSNNRIQKFSALDILSFTPESGLENSSLTITGNGFSVTPLENVVKINGVICEVTSTSPTSLTVKVPAQATTGKLSVTRQGFPVTSATEFLILPLAIAVFTPNVGVVGTSVTITGTGFSSVKTNNTVKFNGIVAIVTDSSPTSITATVPAGNTIGKISVTVNGITVLSTNEFLVVPLAITSFTPGAGIVGTPVTIEGTGFSSVKSNNSVTFSGVTALVTDSTPTRIITSVPSGSTTGKISITVASQAATSVSDFIITKLGIFQTNYPEFFIVDESGANVAILVNDINEIQSIKINRRGITEEDSKLKVDAIPFTTSGNSISLSVPASYFTDPLGVYCSFSITEKAGNEILSQPGNIYLKYPASSNKQVIPDLKSGKSGGAYQLIAVPLELTPKNAKDVFSDLGSYDNKKWRLFSLDNMQLTENPSTIEIGKGYWFITRDQTEINPGAGAVVKATKESPYKMSLNSKWNLIGNPYNFSISWDDVLDYSGLPETKLKFRQFINGSMNNEPILTRYRGGFVWSDVAREIEIPVINKSAAGGRKATTQTQPIDKPEWMVNLTLQDDEFSNSLFGFGMNPNASIEKDLWDETALPLLEGLSPFEMSFGKHLVKDVVPTLENYSWQAQLSASKNIWLRWDNSYFGDNEKQVIIENSNSVETINMRLATEIKLSEGNHLLKFHYGNADYIKDQLMESSARIGNVFPNPIKKSNEWISVSLSLPEGNNEVCLRLKNLLGQDINSSGNGHYEGGRTNIQWQSDFSQVPSGMYLMQIEVKDAKGVTSRITRRIIFE